MAEKVKLSKDGTSIDFVQSDNIPTSLKKFRQSPEIEGFYRFIFENDLQKEAYDILDRIIVERKAKKSQAKKDQKEADAAEAKKASAKAGSVTKTAVAVSSKHSKPEAKVTGKANLPPVKNKKK